MPRQKRHHELIFLLLLIPIIGIYYTQIKSEMNRQIEIGELNLMVGNSLMKTALSIYPSRKEPK